MALHYISTHRDLSGYSEAARHYMMAADSVGIPVKASFLRVTPSLGYLPPEKILNFEKENIRCDTVVQHLLPPMMVFASRTKNVALFASETDSLPLGWIKSLREADEIWVINHFMESVLLKYDLRSKVVPHTLPIEMFQKSYKKLNMLANFRGKHDFLFYTIGEHTRRKNLLALLKAFMLEFKDRENVGLVIKTSKPGLPPDEVHRQVSEQINATRDGLSLRRDLRNYFMITESLTDEAILSLHSSCDCYATASFGEAWGLGAFQALGFGKTPVAPRHTGFVDYLTEDNSYLVDSQSEPVYLNDNPNQVGNWFAPQTDSLRQQLRKAYEDRNCKAKLGYSSVSRFSYQNVGNILRGLICPQNKGGSMPQNTGLRNEMNQ